MKVLHITADVGEASGVGTFVRGINAALCEAGVDSNVLTDVPRSGAADVVHIHGLWLGVHRRAYAWAKSIGAKVVWSTHGMTAPWAMKFKWWKKLPAWWLYQRRMLRGADVVHVTTEQEKAWNVRLGVDVEKIVVVPVGCRLEPRNTRNTRKEEPRKTLSTQKMK